MTFGPNTLSQAKKEQYEQMGFLAGLRIFDDAQARKHVDLFMRFREDPDYEDHRITFRLWHEPEIFAIATHPLLLNCVEALIGPDIALWGARYLSTEPHNPRLTL